MGHVTTRNPPRRVVIIYAAAAHRYCEVDFLSISPSLYCYFMTKSISFANNLFLCSNRLVCVAVVTNIHPAPTGKCVNANHCIHSLLCRLNPNSSLHIIISSVHQYKLSF